MVSIFSRFSATESSESLNRSTMKLVQTDLPEVLLIEPRVFEDPRGYFLESYNMQDFRSAGIGVEFVQDNHSHSRQGVLRGLHYQLVQPQGKLVRALHGEIFDVAVDLRRTSPRYGRWTGFVLSGANRRIAWIPPGFAHGFLVLSASVDVLYKVTMPRYEPGERSLLWNDPAIGIDWPLQRVEHATPLLSPKDREAPLLAQAEVYE